MGAVLFLSAPRSVAQSHRTRDFQGFQLLLMGIILKQAFQFTSGSFWSLFFPLVIKANGPAVLAGLGNQVLSWSGRGPSEDGYLL